MKKSGVIEQLRSPATKGSIEQLRDLERAMDGRPDIQRFDGGDRGIGRLRIERRAQKVGYTLLREEICQPIERSG